MFSLVVGGFATPCHKITSVPTANEKEVLFIMTVGVPTCVGFYP